MAQQTNRALAIPVDRALQSLDLSMVSQHYNVLGPRNVVYATEGMRLRAVVVALSPSPDDGDVYPSPSGGGRLALSKNGLLKLASAKGIIWDADGSRMLGDAPPCEACTTAAMAAGRQSMCPHNVGFRAVGAWLSPTGQWEVHSASKYWSWDEELAEVRRLYRKQILEKRISQAEYDRRVEDEFNKRFRDRFSLAETKAKLRVVREIGVKAAYSREEIARPFVSYHVEPDTSADEIRRRAMASASQIFGTPVRLPAAGPMAALEAGPDFGSAQDLPDNGEESPAPTPQPAPSAPAAAAGPTTTPERVPGGDDDPPEQDADWAEDPNAAPSPQPQDGPADGVVCADCGRSVPANVLAYCQSARGQQDLGGQIVCYACQKKRKAGG